MKLGSDEIFYINELHRISGATARDCLISEKAITFLVKKKDFGKAIGKNAVNIKDLAKKTKKHIEILEYGESIVQFVKKSFYNVKTTGIAEAEKNGGKIVVVSLDAENRKKLAGNMGRLKRIKELAKRHYKVDDIIIR